MPDIKIYTPEEAARILKVTRRSVYGYIKSGRLRAAKVGKGWRVTEESIRELLGLPAG